MGDADNRRTPKPSQARMDKAALIARFVEVTLVEAGQHYRVGSGNGQAGQNGQQVAVIALKRAGGYEIVLHMDGGKLESFAPGQLFPIIPSPTQTTTEPA